VYNQKRKLTKNLKYKTVELPSDYSAGVELAKWCDYVKDTKRSVKCKTEKDWDSENFLEHSLPEWKEIWTKKKVQMRWHRGQRALLLTYIR
jgi:hypothetical protein